MRYIKYFAAMFASALALAACETDVEQPALNPESKFVAPVLNAQSDIVVNQDNINVESVTFTCSEADFGQKIAIRYKLYLSLNDKTVNAATSYYPAITMLKSDINGFVVNGLGVEPNQTVDISAYVVAYAGESETICTAQSNVVSFSITTFKAALKSLFVVGGFQNWSEGAAVSMWETAGGSNIFEGVYHLTEPSYEAAGSDFQLLPTRGAWDGQMGYSFFTALGDAFSEREGNIMLPVGIHKITVDLTNKSIDSKSYSQVDIMGSFDGWAAPMLMEYDNVENVWKSTSTVSGGDEFKIRFNNAWDINFGDGTKAAEPMELDPAGFAGFELVQSAANIVVPGSGSYIVKFYADRTPYVVAYEQQ